ncbi:MAG: ABC transporter ATP-binding protein [Bacilli bacterium]|nr:ABC transporter ATP-binding protein [Bacilli bacterium]
MKAIFRILKKYTLAILLIVVLLFMQAQCDLKLPEYTSNIINVGIQSKGIEYAIFDKVSKNTLDCIVVVSGDYSIYDYYQEDGETYILKDIKKNDKEKLESILIKPIVFISMMSTQEGFVKSPDALTFAMYNETDYTLRDYYKSLDKIEDTMLKQYAIQGIQKEYETIGVNINEFQMSYLFRIGGLMLLLTIIVAVIIVISSFISSRVAASFGYDLREEMVRKITYFNDEDVNKFNTSSLITRCTNDISQIQMALTMFLRMVLFAPIMGIGAVVKLIGNKAGMTWVIACAIGAIILMVMILLFVAFPKFKKIQKLIDRLNQIVREQLNGIPVVRAFANEELETERFNAANTDLTKVNLFTNKIMAFMSPAMTIIMNGTMVLVYWVALGKIDAGTLQVGTLTAFLTYTMHIIMSFMMISMLSIMGPRAMISINRINEVLNTNNKMKELKVPDEFDEKKRGNIEFKNVSFKFPDGSDYVLKNITFSAKKGTTTAIIGATGSGKSALVKLIPRLFDINKGQILVSGVDIKRAGLKDLRNMISYVPQKGYLFNGTVESNIKFSNPRLSDEEMENALEIACAKDFVLEKKKKYKYEIAQGGNNVSGGQRQRLCIARAIAKNADIIILDDSLSALDYKTDSLVRINLNTKLKDKTKIIVAQRVASVMNADQIIVLDNGEIVGKGTHKDLLKKCPIYKQIALSQLREEEL